MMDSRAYGMMVFLLVGVGWGLSAGELGANPEVYLGTSRIGFEKIRVKVLPPVGEKGAKGQGALLATVLKQDLDRTQLFEIVEAGSPDSEGPPGGANLEAASKDRVAAVVWTKLYARKEEWVLEGIAYETTHGAAVVSAKFVGDEKTLRRMAHRFSDKMVVYFSGEEGIAQSRITYVSDETGRKEVYVMDYDGANKMRITGDRSITLSPRWSTDTTMIAYTSYREGSPEVYFIDLGSGRRRKALSFPGINFSPSWAPQGERMAFATTKDGNAEIYTMALDGSDLQRLTFNEAVDLSPTWSPTGKQMAFTSDRGGTPQIYLMDNEGANLERLTFSGNYNTASAWSPKGDWIAYTCRNEARRQKLCLIRVSDGHVVPLTEEGPWDDEAPSWAPSGREIVFTSNRSGLSQLYTLHADGTGLFRLTSHGANDISPAWSPK